MNDRCLDTVSTSGVTPAVYEFVHWRAVLVLRRSMRSPATDGAELARTYAACTTARPRYRKQELWS